MADRGPDGRFLPGNEAGKGHGRPKGAKSLSDTFRHMLESEPPPGLVEMAKARTVQRFNLGELPPDLDLMFDMAPTVRDLLACLRVVEATENLDSFREIGDRLDPKPRRNELSGPGGEPIRYVPVDSDDAEAIYNAMVQGAAEPD